MSDVALLLTGFALGMTIGYYGPRVLALLIVHTRRRHGVSE